MEIKTITVSDEELKEIFPDFAPGPLESYRKKASFDWRRMKLFYDTWEGIKHKHKMWTFMRDHPLFDHSDGDSDKARTLDEERHITVKRMYTLYNEAFLPFEKIAENPALFQADSEAMFMFDGSLAAKMSLTFRMFFNVIQGSGQEHHYPILEAILKAQIGGCFALTEVSHGSNAKGMRTTATYDPERRQFVLHSPDFEAAKCWVGSLGKCATHAIVYAMLVSKGKNHGLHAFVVPIRDTKTLKPFPGVVVGDLGEKIGLNGIDNGFVMFNNYRLPKEAALDKLGGVDDSGEYSTPFRDPRKRFGASLGILSGGRVAITSISASYLQKAVVIAARYSAVRRQFGPEGGEESPVLEYQQQQIRLLPHLATTFAIRVFCNWFSRVHIQLSVDKIMGVADPLSAERGVEMHALSSSAKPVCGWAARDAVQAAREACGGHGYLKASALGDLRNDNDANCTYEGENSLLLQQTSNWLLGLWPRRQEIRPEDSPLGSLDFMKDIDRFLLEKCAWKTVEDIGEPANLVHTYKWLTAYMLKSTHEKVEQLKRGGKDNLQAKNDSQTYYAVTLSVVYGESYILNHFYKSALAFEDEPCRKVLLNLVSLYGAYQLEKHLGTLYIGGFYSSTQGSLLRAAVTLGCARCVIETIALADSLAPPDFCLRSVLGNSDGEVYKHIQNSLLTYPGSMTRPEWWRDVVFWQTYAPSKL